jgi:hypothetical protein
LKTTTTIPTTVTRNPLIPILILTLAVLLLQVPEIISLERLHRQPRQAQMEQLERNAQATRETDARIESLLLQLVDLAKKDPDARAIVMKYGIQYTPPPSPPATGPNK